MRYLAVYCWVHGWWFLLMCNLLFLVGEPPTLFAFLLFNGAGASLIGLSRVFIR